MEHALPGDLSGRPFTVREALAAGVEPSRLRRTDLVVPFRGARILVARAGDADDFVLRCRALLARRPDAVLSHSTAARMLGLPIPWRIRDELHLTVAPPGRPPRIAGVHSHGTPISGRDITHAHGMPVTAPARTWADLSHTLTVRELVALGDAIIHWRSRRSTIGELRASGCSPGARGAARARRALGLMHERSESPQESLLRVILAEAGLPPPDVNVDLRGPDGRFLARPDLRFPEQRVIVEYEGDHHRVDRVQWQRDLVRTTGLQAAGEEVVRVGSAHLGAEKRLVALVYRALAARGWRPGDAHSGGSSSPARSRTWA
jgi:very-short-patch-repair endonuclease